MNAAPRSAGFSPLNPNISHSKRGADFQVCRIAGFQTRERFGQTHRLPIWKSAKQQVWKPAPHGYCAVAPICLWN